MAPKFRGGSDDFLDDEDSAGRTSSKKKKAPAARATALPPEEANATVAEVYPNQCRVRLDTGPYLLCPYRRAGVIGAAGSQGTELRERSPVAVGDRVKVQVVGATDGIVEGLCARTNELIRPAPAREDTVKHVVAANIDVLVIVAASRSPDFSPGLVDRFLIAAQKAGIPSLICVNKIDLHEPGASSRKPWEIYRELGFDVLELSAKRGDGMAEILARITGKRAAFCGHSGVGKTSLLRTLLGRDIGKIGETSELTGKGRHTTTGAVLLEGPAGSQWVDTPGIRAFGLSGVSAGDLAAFFPEFSGLGCTRQGCGHSGEAGCDATGLERYTSYRRVLESLATGEF